MALDDGGRRLESWVEGCPAHSNAASHLLASPGPAARPILPLLCRLLLAGYAVDVRVLNAAHYGVPQSRQARWEGSFGSGGVALLQI